MRRIDLLTGIVGCLFFLLSCTSQNFNSPIVQFITPTVDSVHDLSNELDIEIDLSDDSMLMKYKFWMESESGWEYFSEEKNINKTTHVVRYRFDLSNDLSTSFSLHIEAEDYDGNVTHEQLKVNVE